MQLSTGAGSILALSLLMGCGSPADAPLEGTPSKTPTTSSAPVQDSQGDAAAPIKSRQFTFHYRFRIKDLPSATDPKTSLVRVWMPCPVSTAEQDVTPLPQKAPTTISEHTEAEFGNQILYFECPVPASGELVVDLPYHVVRKEVRRKAPPAMAEALSGAERQRFLRADKLVPTTGKPLKLLAELSLKPDRLQVARQLYDLVDAHVVYKKDGTGWGRGDSEWVCDSGYGNCTDFHSLFISLARSQGVPARFEIGFSIPTGKIEGPVVGYHCWAWFYVDDRGWVPVDVSEADKHPELKEYYFGNLTADRVTFSVGRDLKLVPASTSEPLNYFIAPHVEVDGQALNSTQIELEHSFREEPSKGAAESK